MGWTQFIQEAPAWLEPLPLTVRGERATLHDLDTWHAALILQCCYCAELSENHNLRNPNQLKQWMITIASADIGDLGKQLKDMAVEIRHYASQWSVFNYCSFKDYSGWSLFGVFYAPIKDYFVSFLDDPTAETLSVLLQWTCFLTRITLETGFHDDIDDYLSIESHLGDLEKDDLWDELRAILYPIACTYSPTSFFPHFSNGSNSDAARGLGLWGKYHFGWSCNDSQRYLLWKMGWNVADWQSEETRTCKLIFVPKGIDSQRTICEEPAFNMFCQQGILRSVDEWFSKDNILSRHIHLHDQSYQRRFAQLASMNQSFATLDLSAASDSVSWKLVEYVLDGTELLEELRLTRTEYVDLPTGQTLKLNKFAPMGSAMCFPTECLIFLGICLLGCRKSGVKPAVGVYGDDMIVPGVAEDIISSLLVHFGFSLNEKKSFWGTERFKESCGGEYFDGIDVTPVYISRKFSVPKHYHEKPEAMMTWTDMVNSFEVKGFHTMRRYLLSSHLLSLFPGTFFSNDPSEGVFSVNPTNFHLRERWNPDLQRFEVRRQILSDDGDVPYADDYRYIEILLRYATSSRQTLLYPEDRIDVRFRLPDVRINWRWVHNPYSASIAASSNGDV